MTNPLKEALTALADALAKRPAEEILFEWFRSGRLVGELSVLMKRRHPEVQAEIDRVYQEQLAKITGRSNGRGEGGDRRSPSGKHPRVSSIGKARRLKSEKKQGWRETTLGTDCSGQRATLTAQIRGLEQRLTSLYADIRTALPGADIYAVGYPLLIDPDDTCLDPTELTLSRADKVMMRDLGLLMNEVIDSAAQAAHVISVADDPAARFAGHGACAGALDWDAWINPYVVPLVYTSFHPNRLGQDNYAYAVNNARVRLAQTGAIR